MKIEELQIGNWVFDTNNDIECQVDIKDFRNGGEYILDYYEPIPLTAEILEKNGWRYEDFSKYYADDDLYYVCNEIVIHINKDKFEIRCTESVDIELKYVHELQNILKLMKIEKEIKL